MKGREREIDRQMDRQTNRQMYRSIDRQIDRQRERDRSIDRQIDISLHVDGFKLLDIGRQIRKKKGGQTDQQPYMGQINRFRWIDGQRDDGKQSIGRQGQQIDKQKDEYVYIYI